MNRSNNKKGFTLFVAVITAGVLILISFAISAITTKEVTLANINRESGQAIFAANAGIECALYWDAKISPSAFATSSSPGSISCNNLTMTTGTSLASFGTTTARIGNGGSAQPVSLFAFSLDSNQNPSTACVVVNVTKRYSGSVLVTDISSYGYNNCNTSDKRRVERGIFVRY